MKTQNRKAKKHHNQINEGFVRYSFSEYVHRQGDEQFDEFLGIGKALGGAWNKLTQNQRPGGAPRASAPAPAAAPEQKSYSAIRKVAGDHWPKDLPNASEVPASSYATPEAIKAREIHLARVDGALDNLHDALATIRKSIDTSVDNIAGVLQEPSRSEKAAPILDLNKYVKNQVVPTLKKSLGDKFDSIMSNFDPKGGENSFKAKIRAGIKKKWDLLDDTMPNDVTQVGNKIQVRSQNPDNKWGQPLPRGNHDFVADGGSDTTRSRLHGVPGGSGSAKDQISKSAGAYFDRIR